MLQGAKLHDLVRKRHQMKSEPTERFLRLSSLAVWSETRFSVVKELHKHNSLKREGDKRLPPLPPDKLHSNLQKCSFPV